MWKRRVVLYVSGENEVVQTFSENRIDFTIQSYLGWSADECKIDIYNLSPAIVTELYLLDNKQFQLQVGYEDEALETIMSGRIVNVWGRKLLPNHITTMWCVPNSAVQNNNKLGTKNYTNKSIKEIIEDVTLRNNYLKGSTRYVGFDTNDERLEHKLRNYDTTGTMVEELNRLCSMINARFNCADTYVKITSNVVNNTTVELMEKGGVAIHKINVYEIKGTPEISVASTDITINLSAHVQAGDVLDYTELGDSPLSMQSIFGVSGSGDVLYRDPNVYNYVLYNKYQILTVTHTGSNFAPVWETRINGTVFNEYVTAGDEASHDSSGVPGYTPKVASIQFNTDGSLSAFFPAEGASSGIDEQVNNAANVQLTKEQQQILYDVAGQDEQKRQILENILRIENRGFGKVNENAVSPVGAVGPFQFMPITAKNLGVNNRKDFRESAEGASRYVDEVRNRLGDNFSSAAMYADYNAGPKASGPISRGEDVNLPQETIDYLAMAKALEGGS